MRYYTHDNYSRPFAVDIEENRVEIFKFLPDEHEDFIYTDMPILTYEPQRIFIGKSPECAMTRFSGGYGDRFNGNSILLHIRDDEYVFIGSEVYKFRSDNIVEFTSPVGNNDVPYPYAKTENGNMHLLIENVTLLNFDINVNPDPYDYYYRNSVITTDFGRIPEHLPLIQNHLGITAYYLGVEPYTMRYKTNPSAEYDRLIPEYGNKMYVIIGGIVREFTKDEYINLMIVFGITAGFQPLTTDSIIGRRN